MRPRRAALAVTLAAALVVAPGAGSAWGQPPERSGWWNALSTPLFGAPQPGTEEGDLRVVYGSATTLAYAALRYEAFGATAAELVLRVREGSVQGTPEVAACPTTDGDWEGGDNQPMADAPAYDCTNAAHGVPSADGTSFVFRLDERQASGSGTWSVAIVPAPDAGSPFAIDFTAPGPGAFSPERPATTEPEPFAPPTFTEPSEQPAWPPADAYSPGTDFESAPLDEQTLPGDEPVAAPGSATDAPPAQAAAPPAGQGRRDTGSSRGLALLTLLAGTAFVGWSTSQERTGPRLLGGRARALGAAAAPIAPPRRRDERPRGIGRFAKQRHAPPRRLR